MDKAQEVFRVGLVQMCSADDHQSNIATVSELTAKAADAGCALVALPEVSGLMNRHADPENDLFTAATDPCIAAYRQLAKSFGIWMHIGSTPVLGGKGGRLLNHSALINSEGEIVAEYDKIHLFDITLPNGNMIKESSRYSPGEDAVLAMTPWGPFGMTVCYDLRFPGLFRGYAQSAARLVFVPSAFTIPTGKAHWDVLLRARAIENGCFIVAAAQVGNHADGRKTFGHSMVVDPWGKVVVDMDDTVGLQIVDIDLRQVDARRSQIPSICHDRPFTSPNAPP